MRICGNSHDFGKGITKDLKGIHGGLREFGKRIYETLMKGFARICQGFMRDFQGFTRLLGRICKASQRFMKDL